MNSEHEEYTRENYPSFGKKYNGEKAIISLTSWKARINTVSKTLYSLLKQCPGFHIVLVLSEEEFPKMMDELPENLKVFAENELIEILYVYKNYKSFKKVLFTMDKYRDVPVISADDDCIYTCNYAEELYNAWIKWPESITTYRSSRDNIVLSPWGHGTLHPPKFYDLDIALPIIFYCLGKGHSHDDVFYGFYSSFLHKHIKTIKIRNMCTFLGDSPSFRRTSLGLYRQTHKVNHGIMMQNAFKLVTGKRIMY